MKKTRLKKYSDTVPLNKPHQGPKNILVRGLAITNLVAVERLALPLTHL